MKEFGSGEHCVAIHTIANAIAQATHASRAGNRVVDVAIVAHNAEFDSAFCKRPSDTFVRKAWACSYREVAWRSEGFHSARLGHLSIGHCLFFDAHRALDDGRAALEILLRPLLRSGRTALAVEVSCSTAIDRYSERCP
ncbi:hypothetical protein [Bradyrhizobium vignae]|uniref:Uncharacterized protein n=1 Tax=Bradyrhizobium vignae TaxID=1549949 RepID=A0A2U3PUM0_9BRAD|nr:hypothetical protein [Bradyrhizobium vignae]SPP92857.1 protein of unknown function [Bradyrhizobium vignae]